MWVKVQIWISVYPGPLFPNYILRLLTQFSKISPMCCEASPLQTPADVLGQFPIVHFQWDMTYIHKHKKDFIGLLWDPFYTVCLSGKNYTVYPLYNGWKCLNGRLWMRGKQWRLWSAGLLTGRRPSSLLREELGNGHILNVVSTEGGMRQTSTALYFYGASKKTNNKNNPHFHLAAVINKNEEVEEGQIRRTCLLRALSWDRTLSTAGSAEFRMAGRVPWGWRLPWPRWRVRWRQQLLSLRSAPLRLQLINKQKTFILCIFFNVPVSWPEAASPEPFGFFWEII